MLYYLGRLIQHKFPAAEVFPTYRNAGKLNQAGLQQKPDGSRVFPVNVTPLFINILDLSNDSEAIRSVVATKKYGQLVIINNAGVCLEGNSRSILQETLQVNCLFPARLIETCRIGIDAEQKLVVVNVSSGDGELSYLHRDIERRISNLETYQVSITLLLVINT